MTAEPSILIVSTVADVATDAVVEALTRRGACFVRINTEDLPFEMSLTLRYGETEQLCAIGDHTLSPATVWYRRVRAPARPESMDAGVHAFCLRENRAALLGGLLGLPARWMSHPAAVWQAEFKPHQLCVAERLGLRIPKTLVSNDPEAIRQFHHAAGPLIVKPADSGHYSEGGESFAIYTTRLTHEHLDHVDEARLAPSIYQQLIYKRFDVRVTWVGEKWFAAAIHSQTDPAAQVDWRRTDNPDLPHSRIDLPPSLVDQLRVLMGRLNLKFGCIDLVQTPQDDFVFLEVNPSGQWLWLDDQLDFGISDTIAAWLMEAGS